jgi:aspartate-semialdehyde dehydrogenase
VSDERERLKAQLRIHGDRLREAQAADQREHQEIAKLVLRALDAGISKREIARLAAVGRPWIDKTVHVRRQTG